MATMAEFIDALNARCETIDALHGVRQNLANEREVIGNLLNTLRTIIRNDEHLNEDDVKQQCLREIFDASIDRDQHPPEFNMIYDSVEGLDEFRSMEASALMRRLNLNAVAENHEPENPDDQQRIRPSR